MSTTVAPVLPNAWVPWLAGAQYPPAVVVGADKTGLALARSLHTRGVPVIAVDRVRRRFAGYSGAFRLLLTDRFEDDEGFVRFLDALADQLPRPAVLMLSMDEHVMAVGRYGQHLRNRYYFDFPGADAVELLMSKGRFADHARQRGWSMPATHYVEDAEGLTDVLSGLRFPAVLKPQVKNRSFRAHSPEKVFRCESPEELVRAYELMANWEPEGVVQEWVQGGDGDIFFSMHYLGADLEEVASFEGRKIRQHLPESGSTASAVGVREEQVSSLSREILRDTGCAGFGAVEYKRDPRDGTFYIMEPTVGRVDLQVGVALANNYDLVSRAYFHLIGEAYPGEASARHNGIWVDFPRDFKAARHEVSKGRLTWPGYLRSLRGPRRYAVWNWKDIPLLRAYLVRGAMLPFRAARFAARRLRVAVRIGFDHARKERESV